MPNSKPCPFCGSTEFRTDLASYPPTCKYCECVGPSWPGRGEFIPDWNTRPIEDALRERVKKLEGELLMLGQAYRRGMSIIRAVLPDCGPDPFWEAGEKLKAIATPDTTPITEETQS